MSTVPQTPNGRTSKLADDLHAADPRIWADANAIARALGIPVAHVILRALEESELMKAFWAGESAQRDADAAAPAEPAY